MKIFPRFTQKFSQALPLFLATAFFSPLASAADYLAAEPMNGKKVRIDGMLREWPRNFDRLKTKSGSKSKNSTIVGYDKNYLYLAAKIVDKKIVRSKNGSKGEDHLTLAVHFPAPSGRGKTHHIDIYPGVAGKMAALVKVDGRKLSKAKAIEAPTSKGFTLEARIPWSALAGANSVRVGMRGKVSYSDAKTLGRIQSITSTGRGEGKNMPPLTTSPETGLIQTVLQPKGLSLRSSREVYGDVTGQGGVEKVALYGHFLSIVGPGYKGGKQFYVNELDVEKAKQVTRLSLVDFNGDNKKEILIQKRLGDREKYREVIQVLQIGKDGAPLQVFIHEISLVTKDGRINNKVSVSGSGKNARIKISQGQESGFDPGTFQEPTIGGGIPSALLPWQTTGSRSFGWKGQGLTALEETPWEPKVSKSTAPHQSMMPSVKAPPPPRAPSADELMDRVYALYKNDRGVHRGKKPSFDFVTDVVEDEQMERVLVHDRDLVVFGKGFKKGLSYTYLTIGVKESSDILSVTTRDLVGDGKAEILVHAVIDAQASKSLGGDIVSRQALFVYKIVGENLKRIFAAETARSLKGNRIMSSVAFIPESRGLALELRPLRALGWDQKSYPFPEDRHPAGGMEPLLLPWSSIGSRHYTFNGSEYAQD